MKSHTIVLHYTATPRGMDVGADEIDHWHKERGWDGIGYHFVVRLDGEIERGRPLCTQGAHVYGHNEDTIGVVYVGGLGDDGEGEDTRTPHQICAMDELVEALRIVFGDMPVIGHRDMPGAATHCPGFNAEWEYN